MTKVSARCTMVRDGDSFHTHRAEQIRLANVCCPELNKPGGSQSKRILEGIILGKWIEYEQVAIDVYGRKVAQVWVNGASVNSHMQKLGYICS